MAGTYQHVTLQTVIDQLAVDLGDASQLHFVAGELQLAVVEAYRLWNLLTAYERSTLTFPTTAGTAFYDLTTVSSGADLLGHTVTDREVMGAMQYRLLEPYEPAAGVGMKDQFTFTELLRALQTRRDAFLAITEPVVTVRSPVLITAGTDLYALDDTVIRVVRANWLTLDDTYHPLRGGTDEGVQSAIRPNWRQSPGLPRQWSVVSTPNLNLRLVPTPIDTGWLSLMTIETGAALDTTANSNAGTVLGVPDDVSAGVGWGALELVLSKNGDGADPARAQFAGNMYALYLELARTLPSVLTVTVNDAPVTRSSLRMLDSLAYGWQGRTRATPRTAAILGDTLALYPVPDTVYSVQVELVRRASIPALTGNLQIGREQLAAVRAWAKQLAMFKLGGQSIEQAQRAAGDLITAARTYNEARIADSQYLIELVSSSTDARVPLPRTAVTQLTDADPRDTASSRNTRNESTNYQRPVPRLGGR